MKVRLKERKATASRIPKVGQCWRHTNEEAIYRRLSDKVAWKLAIPAPGFFYSVDLDTCTIHRTSFNKTDFVLLQPVGGELVLEEVE